MLADQATAYLADGIKRVADMGRVDVYSDQLPTGHASFDVRIITERSLSVASPCVPSYVNYEQFTQCQLRTFLLES